MADTQAKASKKKTKKKAAPAADSNPKRQLTQQEQEALLIQKHNPNASVATDGWEEVTDVKKKKFEDKLKKRVDVKQPDSESDEDVKTAEDDPNDFLPKAKQQNGKKSNKNQAQKSGKQNNKQQQQQKKSEPAQPKKPNTEEDLVGLITQILDSTPIRYLGVSAIGDKIQSITKAAWNKTFKPKFGTLREFLQNRGNDFHLDDQFDRVYLKGDFESVAAERAKAVQQKTEKKEKKAAKKRALDTSSEGQTSTAGRKASQAEGGSVLLNSSALVVLAATLCGLTYLVISGNVFGK